MYREGAEQKTNKIDHGNKQLFKHAYVEQIEMLLQEKSIDASRQSNVFQKNKIQISKRRYCLKKASILVECEQIRLEGFLLISHR